MQIPFLGQAAAIQSNNHTQFGYTIIHVSATGKAITVERNDGYQRHFVNGLEKGTSDRYRRDQLVFNVDELRAYENNRKLKINVANMLNNIESKQRTAEYWSRNDYEQVIEQMEQRLTAAKIAVQLLNKD